MKKLIAVLCLLAFLCAALCACGLSEEEKAELLQTAQELTDASREVNFLCYGAGLGAEEGGKTIGVYADAARADMEKYGVHSVADIRAKIAAVYSKETTEWIENTVLTSVMAESSVTSYARYFDDHRPDPEDEEKIVSVLMVHTADTGMTVGEVEYDNFVFTKYSRKKFVFSVDATVRYEEKSLTRSFTYTMRYEDGAWRLSTPTYFSYHD